MAKLKQTVEVMGIPVTLWTDSKDPSRAQRVAKYVDGVAAELRRARPELSADQVAAMTVLEVADRLFEAEKKAETGAQ